MKFVKFIIAAVAFLAVQTISAQSVTSKWTQLHEYHELLSKTFHPAENGNFTAIKNSHDYLVQKAEALDVATMPADLKTPVVVENVAVLKKLTKKLSELITNKAPDVEILRTFQNVHDVFHKIEKECEHPTK
ncbi:MULTISPECIES: hypothetical protein [Flavobacterium]|uniref:Uncharacterized protein n=1 Tax=Flavobacterium stagni TaxID=2506421 RepID=A0A4V1N2U5_9FLAO|nr:MULTISPECIES: hypothetical protein [Flavobacterium]RXR23444.1 hypothetical protein EQG61_05605 [Flavobacterium stagni]